MSRAVITGIGAVAPNGFGVEDHWQATLAGRTGIGPVTRFDIGGYPSTLAGEIADFDPVEHLPRTIVVQTDRGTQLGLVAAEMALADATLDPNEVDEFDIAVITASACGGAEFGQREIEKLWSKGPRFVGPFQSIAWFYAATTGQISIRHGMRGACGVVAAEQAGSLEAIAQGRRLLDQDDARAVVVGGTESSICPYGLVAQLTTGQISLATDPATGYQPFGEQAGGYVPGEGGGMLIIEDSEHAQARGAQHEYGVISGYAATFDPGGRARPTLQRSIEQAVRQAGLTPADIDVVFADAVGVPELDLIEASVLAQVFGHRAVPVSAPKSLIGRLHAGGAVLDVIAALLSIRDSVVPPSGSAPAAARHHLDLATEARSMKVTNALVIARGYGGFNSSMVVSAA
jgi:act minimal PKS chain-length factor (CLF/KS beta)